MPHTLILGMTGSGKTTLAVQTLRQLKRKGYGILICDAIGDPRYSFADVHTSDKDVLREIAMKSRRCIIAVDEAGEYMKLHDPTLHWLATRGRHYGHSSMFICQRLTQIAPLVRHQCYRLACFSVAQSDAKILADEFGQMELASANLLKQGRYLYCVRFQGCVQKRVRIGAQYATMGPD